VTTYKTTTYYEPVTSYRTSYYYEPCTSYRYSCCYDPCTCRYQQVATPVTSYRLRSQCCPVTSYLQRCCLTPCTSYQQVTYYEPQTSCCTTQGGTPTTVVPGAAVTPAVPGTSGNPPTVTEGRQPVLTPSPGAPNVTETREPAPVTPAMPEGSTKFNRGQAPFNPNSPAPRLGTPFPASPTSPAPKTGVRLDRVASSNSPVLQGQVVRNDQQPQAGARVLLVCQDAQRSRQETQTDSDGQFHVTLASGSWLLYTYGADGQPKFQQRIEVVEKEKTIVRLVNR
jgi:hypothetical protein